MAAAPRTQAALVETALTERTPHFTFVQAVWLLQRAKPRAAPLGHQGPPEQEALRLRPSTSLAFPPGDLELFEVDADRVPASRLTTTFMGLYGAHSPLPSYYAEEILQRVADDEDHPVRDFFDIFNHRLLSLLYRGIVKYRGHMLFSPGADDEFSWRLFALSGLSADGVREACRVPAPRLLRFAGLLSRIARPAAAVTGILSCWFDGLPVAVRQCVPRWVYLRDDQRSRLGRSGCRLGDNATIGERVIDHCGQFRVVVGPTDFDAYSSFLPEGDRLATLRRLVALAAPDWLAFDTELVLKGADTPELGITLGRRGHLGWTTGLFTAPGGDLSVIFS